MMIRTYEVTVAGSLGRSAREAFSDVAACVAGIHVEGPYISEVDGYRGAHPREAVRDPDWNEFQALQDAARVGGTAVLMRPTPVAAVAAVAAAGARMPRKSTLFTPKPASGLVMRRFADN